MSEVKERGEVIFQGIPASPGLAHGPAFVFFQKELEVPAYGVEEGIFVKEEERFHNALASTKKQIHKIRQAVFETLGEAEAQIFDAHFFVLEDKALIDETMKEMRETYFNIDYCFFRVAERYVKAFEKIDDDYIRERSTDIRDVSKRVIRNLLGEKENVWSRFEGKRVIVSEDLAPSDTAEVSHENLLALATNKGSRTSHSVIMARSLQIPAVVGLRDITEHIENDDYLVVDGYDGVVIVNPSEATMSRYAQIRRDKQSVQKVFESVNPLGAKTKDGVRLKLYVNIEGDQDIEKLYKIGSDGIGLFRTEAIFLRRDTLPSEEEQFEIYKNVAEAMAPEIVTIRTLDLGGDKRMHSLFFSEKEENPFMGFRAIRFCLEHKDVFKEQLRAILRASAYGNVQLMYPMIISVQEIVQANELLEQCKEELREKGIKFNAEIKIGSMMETPSAAITADLIAEHCDFFSIGTNDLIQYTLAVDRVNDRISHLYQPNHPAVIRMIKLIVDAGHSKNISVSVCGEMAGDPIYASLLIGMGVNSLSVTASMLPETKYLIRAMKLKEAKVLAQEVLGEGEPYRILKLLREFYIKQMADVLG